MAWWKITEMIQDHTSARNAARVVTSILMDALELVFGKTSTHGLRPGQTSAVSTTNHNDNSEENQSSRKNGDSHSIHLHAVFLRVLFSHGCGEVRRMDSDRHNLFNRLHGIGCSDVQRSSRRFQQNQPTEINFGRNNAVATGGFLIFLPPLFTGRYWHTRLPNVSKMKTSNIILWVAIIGAALTFGLLLHAQQPPPLERTGDPPLHYKPGQRNPKSVPAPSPPPAFQMLGNWGGFGEPSVHHLRVVGHEYLTFMPGASDGGIVVLHSPDCSNPKCQPK